MQVANPILGRPLYPVQSPELIVSDELMKRCIQRIFLAATLTVAALLAFGLYLQHGLGLKPCPLCIVQRIAFFGVGLFALLGVMLARWPWAGRGCAAGMLLCALGGLGTALWQSWLQRHPPSDPFACGPGLDYLMETLPLAQWLPKVFAGEGQCTAIDWTFLGLTIANWSALWFALFAGFAAWLALRRG